MIEADARSSAPKRHGEIVDAAASVFAEKGFHGASTKDIADRLGIRQAGIYYYFKSKDAALGEVCRLGVAGYVERIEAIVAQNLPADDKIRRAVLEHLRPFHRIRDHVLVFHNERRYLQGEDRTRVARLAHAYEQAFETIFFSGAEAGTFRAGLDCRLATRGLLGMCNSVSAWYDGGSEAEIEAIAAAYAELILSGVTAQASLG